ncbi:MAG: fibronectin type III domain-containing protein, partial [Thermoplasmata archaeon]
RELSIQTIKGTSSTKSFVIYNRGSSNLNIEEIKFYLEESTSSCKNFVIATQPSPIIPPGASSTVAITVDATNLTAKDIFYCKYIIKSNDPYRQYTVVKINIAVIGPPTAPQDLKVEKAGSQKLQLLWNEPNDLGGASISFYKIYRKVNATPTQSDFLASTSSITYLDSGLTNGTRYCYAVSAVNIAGEGPLSSPACGIPSEIPPPPSLSATPGNKQITLSWNVTNDGGSPIQGYNVYWKLSNENNWRQLTTNLISTNTFTHTNLNICNTYNYYVEAINENGKSAPSNIASATPFGTSSPPQKLSASSTLNSIILNWQAPSDASCASLTRYNIYRSTDGTNFNLIASTSPSTLTYTDTNVTSTYTYTYYVKAQNSFGESDESNRVSARVGLSKCSPPSNLQATPSDRKITLNWSASPSLGNGDYYFVYSSTNNSNYSKVATTVHPTVTFTHTNLINGQKYYYYVTAKGTSCEESNPSNIASSTPGTVPSAPQDFVGQAFKDRIDLKWKEPLSNGGFPILQYNLYRTDVGKIATLSSSTFSYSDTSITLGTLYQYSISASNILGEGQKDYTTLGYCLSWLKTLGGSKDDWPAYIYLTSDGGYLIVGKTTSFTNDSSDPADGIIIKIDSIGNVEWAKSIGTLKEDSIRSAIELSDGFIITGETRIDGNSDIFIAKISTSTGNIIWAKKLGGSNNESNSYLSRDENNNVYLGFNTNSWGPQGSNIVIMKLSQNGDILWAKLFGGSRDDLIYKLRYIKRTVYYKPDKLVVIGYTQSFGAGNYDFLVLSLDPQNGGPITIKTFGGAQPDYLFDFIVENGGDYLILFGRTLSFGAGSNDFLVVGTTPEMPPSQAVTDAWTYGTVNQDYGFSLARTYHGLLFLGMTNSLGMGYFDLLLIRTPTNFYPVIDVKTFGGNDDDRLPTPPSDSNFLDYTKALIAARTKSVGGGGQDIVLIKLDPATYGIPYKPDLKFQSNNYPTTSIIVQNVRNQIVTTEIDRNTLLNLDLSALSISNLNLLSNDIKNTINQIELISCTINTTTVPSPPRNLTVTYNPIPIRYLTWEEPSSNGGSTILYYNIYRKITDSGSYNLAGTTTNFYFYDNLGSPDDKYCYKVTAVNSIGESSPSNEACIAPDVPGAPSLTVTPGNRQNTLSWTQASSSLPILYYNVYQVINNQYYRIATTSSSIRTYIHQNLTPGRSYYYAVSGVNSIGEGSYSNIASGTPYGLPSPPQSLNITVGDRVLNLSWIPPADNGGSSITEYRIYRKESGQSYSNTPYAIVSSSQLSFQDTNVNIGRTYCYVVTAKNASGESEYSNEVCKKAGTKPGQFSIMVSDYGSNFVRLNWNCITYPENPLCTGGYPILYYKLYRSTNGVNYTLLAQPLTNTYVDRNLSTGMTYYYKVSAVNEIGEGPLSDAIAITPQENEIDYAGYILRAWVSRITGNNLVAHYTEYLVWKLDFGSPTYVNHLKLIVRNLVQAGMIKIYCDNQINSMIQISSIGTTTIQIAKTCSKIYLTALEFPPFDLDDTRSYIGLGIPGSAQVESAEWFQANIKDFDVYARILNLNLYDDSIFLEGRIRAYK